MNAIFFSIAAFISTFLGGLISLHQKERLHHIMGFAAGVIMGVIFFDIFPEIMELVGQRGSDPIWPMLALVVGFLFFHIIEKSILLHHSHENEYGSHTHPHVGVASALALIGHSFMDGVGIGLGFQVSPFIGLLVAFAVIAHDFTDGMNTVSLLLHHKNSEKRAKWFLFFDALAPILGALSATLFVVPYGFLLLYLGFFAGFLLYIAASDILPEAHSKHSSFGLIGLTALGMALIFVITRLI